MNYAVHYCGVRVRFGRVGVRAISVRVTRVYARVMLVRREAMRREPIIQHVVPCSRRETLP